MQACTFRGVHPTRTAYIISRGGVLALLLNTRTVAKRCPLLPLPGPVTFQARPAPGLMETPSAASAWNAATGLARKTPERAASAPPRRPRSSVGSLKKTVLHCDGGEAKVTARMIQQGLLAGGVPSDSRTTSASWVVNAQQDTASTSALGHTSSPRDCRLSRSTEDVPSGTGKHRGYRRFGGSLVGGFSVGRR